MTLRDLLMQSWNQISRDTCQHPIESMPCYVRVLLVARRTYSIFGSTTGDHSGEPKWAVRRDESKDYFKEESSKKYICQHCVYSTISKMDMIRHQRIHSGEKPFRCLFCTKMFTQKSNLKVHIRIHTGERPYCCQYCQKLFSRKQHLENHILEVHKGYKPFACSQCNKTFFRKSLLKKHSVLHSKKIQ